MSVTQAGDILGILEASRDVLAGIDGILSAWVLTPTVGPDDPLMLPAAMQHISLDELEPHSITYATSLEVIDYQWIVDIVVPRTNDLRADQEAVMAFVPKVTEAYREHITLGTAVVKRCLPVNFRLVTVTLGKETYFAGRFRIQAHAKHAVEIRSTP